MNEEQYFYLKLAEEASEVAHMCSKIMQFGRDERMNNTEPSNEKRLGTELNDFLGVLNFMVREGHISFTPNENAHEAKVNKMFHYLKQSRVAGFVEETRGILWKCSNVACLTEEWHNIEDHPHICHSCQVGTMEKITEE